MKKIYVRNQGATATLVGPAGKLAGWHLYNGSGAVAFIQCFDKATVAEVTVGTTVPNFVLVIPTAGVVNAISAFDGAEFQYGFVIACTTEDDNSTAPSWGTNTTTGDFTFLFQ